jgi:hypothetical protein
MSLVPFCFVCSEHSELVRFTTFEYYQCPKCKKELHFYNPTTPKANNEYVVRITIDQIITVCERSWTGPQHTFSAQSIIKENAYIYLDGSINGNKVKKNNNWRIGTGGLLSLRVEFKEGRFGNVNFEIEAVVDPGGKKPCVNIGSFYGVF